MVKLVRLQGIGKTRLAKVLENFNQNEERAIAEEGLGLEPDAWPAY
jgi:hypothetical protein